MKRLGIRVEKRIPTLVEPNPYSAEYLRVKRVRLRHELPLEAATDEHRGNDTAAGSDSNAAGSKTARPKLTRPKSAN
jgi:hypothetical protein